MRVWCWHHLYADMMELADMADSKSVASAFGFESQYQHQHLGVAKWYGASFGPKKSSVQFTPLRPYIFIKEKKQ